MFCISKTKILILIYVCAFLYVPIPANCDPEWVVFRIDEGIAVYSRNVAGRSEDEFKATTVINQPLEVVGAVIMDVPSYKKWVDQCKSVMTIQEKSPLHQIVYFSVNTPWPVTDRDVIYRIKTTVNSQLGKMTVKAVALKDMLVPENDAYVRIKDAQYLTLLERIAPQQTKVTYTCRINASGNLHPFAANLISGNIIYNSINNLKNIAPDYRYSKIVDRYRHYFVKTGHHNSRHNQESPLNYTYAEF